jgi:glutamate/tyrosine decarboxylase-like PLP-dependent enzyme
MTGVVELMQLAAYLGELLSAEPGLDILNEIASNQVAISCDHDDLTSRVLERVQENGKVYPSHGVWRGRRIIRVSIINHSTDHGDIELLADELRTAQRHETSTAATRTRNAYR